MPPRKWTDEQRADAISIGHHAGWAEAERQTGIPRNTIRSWAIRAGVETSVGIPPGLVAAQETAAASREQRRAVLADGLLDDVGILRGRLFAPMTYVHVKLVGRGEGRQDVEQVQVDLDQPTPTDQHKLVQSIVALIEKVQLLTGEATSRDETGGLDLMAELQQHQAAQAEAAAMAKARGVL